MGWSSGLVMCEGKAGRARGGRLVCQAGLVWSAGL